jgi:hypothetical protein
MCSDKNNNNKFSDRGKVRSLENMSFKDIQVVTGEDRDAFVTLCNTFFDKKKSFIDKIRNVGLGLDLNVTDHRKNLDYGRQIPIQIMAPYMLCQHILCPDDLDKICAFYDMNSTVLKYKQCQFGTAPTHCLSSPDFVRDLIIFTAIDVTNIIIRDPDIGPHKNLCAVPRACIRRHVIMEVIGFLSEYGQYPVLTNINSENYGIPNRSENHGPGYRLSIYNWLYHKCKEKNQFVHEHATKYMMFFVLVMLPNVVQDILATMSSETKQKEKSVSARVVGGPGNAKGFSYVSLFPV